MYKEQWAYWVMLPCLFLPVLSDANPADLFEPNDTFAEAPFFGTMLSRRVDDIAISPAGDYDLYLIRSAQHTSISVHAWFQHAAGDLDLVVYDKDQQEISLTTSSTDDEHIVFQAKEYEHYYVGVYGYSGSTNQYDLEITGGGIQVDRYSPGNNFREHASLFGYLGSRVESNLTVEAGLSDYFTFSAVDDGEIWIRANFIHALGDLDMQLLNEQENPLDAAVSATDNEHLFYAMQKGSNYILRVHGYSSSDVNLYDLIFAGPVIPPDRYESNPTLAQAHNLGWMYDIREDLLSIHTAGEIDWFKMTAAASGMATVSVHHISRDFAPGIRLYNSAGSLLETSTRIDNLFYQATERLTYPLAEDATYYVSVFEGDGHVSIYDLTIDGPALAIDRYESNDDPNNLAYYHGYLGTFEPQNLTLHRYGDQDIYKFSTLGTGTLKVALDFKHEMGNIDVSVTDWNGSLVGQGTSHTDDEFVEVVLGSNSNFLVTVYSPANAKQKYNLLIKGPWDYPRPDTEPNEDFPEATDLGTAGLLAHSSRIYKRFDQDYYRFTPARDGNVTVNLFLLDGNGDLDIELYDAAYNPLNYSSGNHDLESLDHTCVQGQVYYVRVHAVDEDTNTYTLEVNGPTLQDVTWQPPTRMGQNHLLLRGMGQAGKTYSLQQGTNLIQGFNQTLRTGLSGGALLTHTVRVDQVVSPRYFRLVEEPPGP